MQQSHTMVILSVSISASPAILWQTLVNADQIFKWWDGGIVLEHHLGGRFEEPWTNDAGQRIVTTGKVLAFDPQERLCLSWKDPDWPAETEVEITLREVPEGTELTLVHKGWERLTGLDHKKLLKDHESGWNYLIRELARVAESGA